MVFFMPFFSITTSHRICPCDYHDYLGMIERCKAYSSCLAGILSIVLPSDETISSSPRNAFSSSIRLPANSMPAFNLSENSLFDIISYYFKSGFYNNCGHIIFATLSYLYGRECTVVIYFP